MKRTPWGKVISVTEVAEGIEIVHAEHGGERCGGIHLSSNRKKQLESVIPFDGTQTRLRGAWFEYRYEWVVPAIVFRDLFDRCVVDRAVDNLKFSTDPRFSHAQKVLLSAD